MTALSESEYEVFWLRLETSGRQQESRSLPDSIIPVTWRKDDRPLSFEDYPGLLDEFKQAVSQVKPDLVHAGPIQRVAYLPAMIGFHPLLTMSWGFDLLEDAYRDENWKEITNYVLENSDWFTSDCQTTRDQAVKFGMQGVRTTVFPWGVDLDLFNPGRRGMMRRQVGFEEDFLIVHTRSWEPRYGVDIALQGFWQAYQQEPNLRLFMLGGGSQEEMVRGFIKEKKLEDRIHLCGYKQNEALAGYYQAADAYLSASHIDGSSVALMESMACGCPPLVSDIPANLEWVSEREGWIFCDGNASDLSEKIISIAADRRKSLIKGRHARLKTEAKADWKKNVQTLMDTYQQVLNCYKKNKQ